jgi:hypothetical protein
MQFIFVCSAFDFCLAIKEISINSKNKGAKLSITTLHQMHDGEGYWGSNSRGEFLCMTCTDLAKLQKRNMCFIISMLSSRCLLQSDDARIS